MISIRNRSVSRRLTILISAALGLATASSAYLVGRARAAGIPATQAMVYSGTLTDLTGAPLTGSKNIQVSLWDAATAGNQVCMIGPAAQTLSVGTFQVALPDACVTAVHARADLWVELFVDGATLGRSKLGATPYAVEADTASHARSGFDVQGGNFSVVGTAGQRSLIAGVTGCGTSYAGLSVQGTLSGCTDYSLLGDGTNLFLNRLTAGDILFRGNNVTQMDLKSNGSLQVLSAATPLNFTSAWSSTPDAVTNVAEISNDISAYKGLMIVGNQSAGLGRRVIVYDRLEVNGTFVNNSTRTAKKEIRKLSSEDYDHVLDTLGKTDVYYYKFKAAGIDKKQRIGVIAEESPTEILDETGKGVSMLDYNGFMLATLKGQQAQLRALGEEVRALKRALAEKNRH